MLVDKNTINWNEILSDAPKDTILARLDQFLVSLYSIKDML